MQDPVQLLRWDTQEATLGWGGSETGMGTWDFTGPIDARSLL